MSRAHRVRLLSCVLALGTAPWIVFACGTDAPSGAESTDGGTHDADAGASPTDAGSDGGEGDLLPGDPPSSTAAVRLKINGVERSFDGLATWSRFHIDGGTVEVT